MNKIINTPLPINYSNLSPEIQKYFNPHYIYETQQVKLLNNCYVTFNGIVLSNLKYVRECFYKPVKYEKQYYFKTLKLILLSFVTRWGRKNKLVLSDKVYYSIIHQPYINYFHWVIESLSRLIILENKMANTTIIFPKDLLNIKYVKDSLSLLGVDNIKIVESDNLLFVKKIALPSIVRWGGHNDPQVLLQLRNKFLDSFRNLNLQIESPERLFIKRSGRRKIENFDEIAIVLKKHNFKIIDFDGVSIYEQIGIMQNVRLLVAQHGASLTNMMFMPPGGTIVEIHNNPVKLNNRHLDDEYFNISSCFNHKYYAFISDPLDDKNDFFSKDCRISITDFEKMVIGILKNKF